MLPPVVRLPALAGSLAAALFAAVPAAHADLVPLIDMLNGIRMTQEQCAGLPQTVWVASHGRSFCMRYYLSTAGGEGVRPAVFIQGDKFGKLNMRTGEFALRPHDKDIDTENLVRFADSMSKQFRLPAIYLARVGVDGSSGDHRIRHSVLELSATNAALDAIKQRHGFDGFHLLGQSGGSTLAGGMLALRSDIGCAVLGAGRLAGDKPAQRSHDPAREYFNVADSVGVIAQRKATRILLVTDPQDKKVPERMQTNFVRALRQAGGEAEQFIVQALDDDRHGVTPYTRVVAANCVRGVSNEVIAQRLDKMVEKRVAAKIARQQAPQVPASPDRPAAEAPATSQIEAR